MGRKPKNISSNETAADAEAAARTGVATAPARRGRKPKLAAIPAEVMAAPSSNNAASDAIGAGGAAADMDAPPVRRRPGPKPKQPVATAETASPRAEAGVKHGRKARASSPRSLDSAPASDVGAIVASSSTPTTSDGDAGGSIPVPEPSMTARQEATRSVARGPRDSAQPAAHWDRATDTVRFDWAAIEQTASQDGPNQVMAKLLVAARAEGANSRWPL